MDTTTRLNIYEELTGATRWWMVCGPECDISIEARPSYCDRGRFVAKLFPRGKFALEIDGADAWPRYYFDWDRMLLEIEAWLKARNQYVDPADLDENAEFKREIL
jgi:hypothetical protein